jgi:hypothetical protein
MPDGQPVDSRSIRLHLKAETFRLLCHSLDTLFSYLKVKTVILAVLITKACILFLSTASELYVRDLNIYVPSDCVAAPMKRTHRCA